MFKPMDLKIIAILRLNSLLNWPYETVFNHALLTGALITMMAAPKSSLKSEVIFAFRHFSCKQFMCRSMAFHWRADDGPVLNAGWVVL